MKRSLNLRRIVRHIPSLLTSRWIRPVRWLNILCLVVAACATMFLVADQLLLPLPTERLHRPGSTFVYSREGRLLSAFTSSDQFWRKPVGLEQITPGLVQSVIATEDKYFYYHPGVNLVSLAAAAVANVREGRVVRGGSTITMQIARMIEPKARTIPNKLFEMFRALQLEFRYSKSELLEFYFNLAPYGGNIEGVGAAAHFYFGKEPSDLTWSEIAVLTAIPGSPERLRPDRNQNRAGQRSHVILKRLLNAHLISSDEYDAALVEDIPQQRSPVPHTAPHLCASLRSAHPDSTVLRSTVKHETQVVCDRLARQYHRKYSPKDIHNLAIVVLDNHSAEVLALVGSPDFEDIRHSGQVDGSAAPRSPGSALKPFVYALAFDQGLLSTEMKVADIPVSYAGYQPENYDDSCRGVVSVREALIHSLNIPAVNAAVEVGLDNIHALLRRGGLTSLNQPHYHYGLPLVLGACEVRLVELANLYSTLARGGVYQPSSYLLGEKGGPDARIVSEGASYLISDILIDLQRPDLADSWPSASGRFPVAWKTGTSYGRRDAWAIGYTPRYTVGVWAGNFSGEGSVDLVGASIAAPVMFDILNEIGRESARTWFEPPAEVGERQVCAVSGQPLGRFCDGTITELFLIGTSQTGRCSIHRPAFVNRETGLRLRPACVGESNYERRVFEVWPAPIASWLVVNGMMEPLPPYNTGCLAVHDGQSPTIISPEDGSVFELIAELPPEYQKIRLQASVPTGDGMVHWFIDGLHLAATEAGELTFYTPARGHHAVLCLDDAGQSATAGFVVE